MQVDDAAMQQMIGRIRVISDATLDARGHAAVDLVVTTTDGRTHLRQLDIPVFAVWLIYLDQHRLILSAAKVPGEIIGSRECPRHNELRDPVGRRG